MSTQCEVTSKQAGAPLGFFERYLTLWVVLCIIAGTLLGLGIAYLLHLLIPWNGVLSILGMVLMVVAMNVLMRKTIPYWVYTSILTPAIILLVTTPTTFDKMETARLIATLSGAALALIAEAALVPLYRSDARRHGQSHY